MTVVHDNECMKNKKTMFKNSYLSRNNSEETIESMTLKTNEHNDQKQRKSNPAFYFYDMSKNNYFSLLSFFLQQTSLSPLTCAFLLVTDSYIIYSSYKVIWWNFIWICLTIDYHNDLYYFKRFHLTIDIVRYFISKP